MRVCHRLDAVIKRLDEVRRRAIFFARAPGDHRNAGEHILDPVVEFSDQQALVLLRPLAPRDIDVDPDHTCWASIAVVGNEHTRT